MGRPELQVKSISANSLIQLDTYNTSLQVYQKGMESLKSGSELLGKYLSPTFNEKFVAVFSKRTASNIRMRRLMNIDIGSSHKRLIADTDMIQQNLQIIIDNLREKQEVASDASKTLSKEIESLLEEINESESEIINIREEEKEIKTAYSASGNVSDVKDTRPNTEDSDGTEADKSKKVIEKQSNAALSKRLDQAKSMTKYTENRERLRNKVVEYNTNKAKLIRYNNELKTALTHAEYSSMMLNKLMPLQEIIEGNKQVLLNRLDMLNKSIASGSILNPLTSIMSDMDTISSQFAEANSIMSNMFDNVSINYDSLEDNFNFLSDSVAQL